MLWVIYPRYKGYTKTESFKAPRPDYTSGAANRRPHFSPRQDDRPCDRGNNVNVRFVRRQIDRRNSNFNSRSNRNSEEREFHGRRQGKAEGNSSGRFNPNAQRFDPSIGTTPVTLDRNDRSHNNEAQTLNN
jgi:hypothetical protein